MTESYLFLSSSLIILVEARTYSASSLKQYSNVLTCLTSGLLTISDATQNCSKRFFHFGQLSGCLKSKPSGSFNWSCAVAILTPLPPCRRVPWLVCYIASSSYRSRIDLLNQIDNPEGLSRDFLSNVRWHWRPPDTSVYLHSAFFSTLLSLVYSIQSCKQVIQRSPEEGFWQTSPHKRPQCTH